MTPGYAFHPDAEADLTEIWEYIAADDVNAADRLIEEIEDGLNKIARFPNLGRRRPDLTSRPLRFLRVRDYLIAYAPGRRPLWIIAIIHGVRSPRTMAAILRGRED